jgi:hypothetical protein
MLACCVIGIGTDLGKTLRLNRWLAPGFGKIQALRLTYHVSFLCVEGKYLCNSNAMLFSQLLCATLAYVQYSRADDLPDDVSRGGDSSSLSIELSNGDIRNYLLHVPRNYNTSSPVGLLWVYAGRGGDNGHAESFTQFSDPKYNPNMMVVYPQGTPDPTGEDVWQGDPNAKTDDINFTLELLDDLQKTYAIDEGRIYAAGQFLPPITNSLGDPAMPTM